MTTLKKHTTVNIYEDPITELKLEGKACLLHTGGANKGKLK